MLSPKQSNAVGNILSGLRVLGTLQSKSPIVHCGGSTTPAARGRPLAGNMGRPAGTDGNAAVVAAGVVLGHIAQQDIARIKRHLANGGEVRVELHIS